MLYYLAYSTSASSVSITISLTTCFLLTYMYAVDFQENTAHYITPSNYSFLYTGTINTRPLSHDLHCFSMEVKYFPTSCCQAGFWCFHWQKNVCHGRLIAIEKLRCYRSYPLFHSFCSWMYCIQDGSLMIDLRLTTWMNSQQISSKCEEQVSLSTYSPKDYGGVFCKMVVQQDSPLSFINVPSSNHM